MVFHVLSNSIQNFVPDLWALGALQWLEACRACNLAPLRGLALPRRGFSSRSGRRRLHRQSNRRRDAMLFWCWVRVTEQTEA